MKKNPAKLFVLLSFDHETTLIEALSILEKHLGTSFYFSTNFNLDKKMHKLLAYDKKFYVENLIDFFASQKTFRKKIKQSLAEFTFGILSHEKVQTIHETDGPYRIYASGFYHQVQLIYANYTYLPISGTMPALANKVALTFFADLRHFLGKKDS